jgi:hypothetical protein
MKKIVLTALAVFTIAVVSSGTKQAEMKRSSGVSVHLYVNNFKKDLGSAD